MIHDSRDSEHDQQALLDHYRQHSRAEPSAGLDARILAAARAATLAAPPWPARVQAWLFAGPVRWSVVLGSLAVFGLGLGLSIKTLERAPGRYDQTESRPMAAAAPPAAAPSVAASAEAQPHKRLSLERRARTQSIAGPQADEAAPLAEPAPARSQARAQTQAAPLKPAAPAPVLNAELQVALEQVLALRREGSTEQADAAFDALSLRYPDLDLSVELLRLQAQGRQE